MREQSHHSGTDQYHARELRRRGKLCGETQGRGSAYFRPSGGEIEHLQRAGIETEVVPGITAALGAAAIAQVPLTDRRMAAQVVFVSAHRVPDIPEPDWSGLAAPDTTIVVYMPGTNYQRLATRLSCAGLRRDTPCLVVAKASTAEQRLHLTTIDQLHHLQLLPSPSLVIVGKVAALAVSKVPAKCGLRVQLLATQGDGETAIQSSSVTRQVLASLGAEPEPVH